MTGTNTPSERDRSAHADRPGATDALADAAEGRSAKSIVTTLLGEFVLPSGGTVWTSTIIDGLARIGFDERNSRQAMARLGDDGLVSSERHGRRARWRLTREGERFLRAGTERIYSLGDRSDTWDGTWTVVVCPIPESRRKARHQFRTRMAFEGFGFLTPTIAISPHGDREAAANEILTDLDEVEGAATFKATTGTLTDDETLLTQAWQLDDLAAAYQEFVDRFADVAPIDDADALAWTVVLVDAWRRFPFLDPELPSELLAPDWIGFRARDLFDRRRAEWRPRAVEWFTAAEEAGAA